MLIGHERQTKYFRNVIKNGSLGHAYLFSGPEMIGKKTFALNLAKQILGEGFEDNPDYLFISPKEDAGESKIYINDIRDLKKTFSYKNYGEGIKIVVLNDAHCLTSEAANAFLKILEEPPADTLIVLISSMPSILPATIISRCEEVRFLPANSNEVMEALSGYKNLTKNDKDFMIKLVGGRIGYAKYLVENGSLKDAMTSIEALRAVFSRGAFERIEYSKKIYESGRYRDIISNWLFWMTSHVALSPKNEVIAKKLLSLNYVVSQPQFNHKLAIENFLLNL